MPLALLAVVARDLDVHAGQRDAILLRVVGHGQSFATAQRGVEVVMGLRVRAGAAQIQRQVGEQRGLASKLDALPGAVGGITGETDSHEWPPGRRGGIPARLTQRVVAGQAIARLNAER
ncbi:hypothetical protein D9M68_690460 [compost metagenome]